MAGARTATVGLHTITARPKNKLRKRFDMFPYWQSSRPTFELMFTALADTSDCNFLYALQFSNGQKTSPQQLKVSALKEGAQRTYIIGNNIDMFLVYTGDTFLVVADITEERTSEPYYQTVYMFHTTSKAWLALAILAGILAGVFSTFGNCIANIQGC